MAFPMLMKKRLLDELWARASKGQRAPSLRFIAKSASLASEDEALRLLREMKADGPIDLVREGPYPWLTLRRQSYTGPLVAGVWLDPEKMERETLQPQDADAPSPAIQLRAEVERRLPAEMERLQPAKDAKRQKVETAETKGNGPEDALTPAPDRPSGTGAGEPPAQAAEAGEQAREPQPQAVEARRFESRIVPGGKQINIKVPDEVHAALVREAEKHDVFIGTVARAFFLEAWEAAQCDTRGRHRLSASVQRAWRDDGRSLDVFVTALIDIGLEEYRRFRDQRDAA